MPKGGGTARTDDRQFQTTSAVLEDQRRLIAALKLQRWDVVKWVVAVNIALGTAVVAFKSPRAGVPLAGVATVVAFVGWLLMRYYNLRLTRTRADTLKAKDRLIELGVTFEAKGSSSTEEKGFFYDWQELVGFSVILLGSAGFVWIVALMLQVLMP